MPKKKLIQTYTIQDVQSMQMLGGIALYTIMKSQFYEEEQLERMKQISMFQLIMNSKFAIDKLFPGKYPGIDDSIDLVDLLAYNEKDLGHIYIGHEGLGMQTGGRYYKNDILEKPINDVRKALQKLSKELKEYIDTTMLTEEEEEIATCFKDMIDIWADGRSVIDKQKENTAYAWILMLLTCGIKFATPTCMASLDNNTGEITLNVHNAYSEFDWKDVFEELKKANVTQSLLAAYRVTKAEEAYNSNGDVNRYELMLDYENYCEELGKVLSMKAADYNKYSKYLGTGYVDFAGDRAYRFALDEAFARAQLLKAGYPISDLSTMSQFYMAYSAFKRVNAKNPDGAISAARVEEMERIWVRAIGVDSLDDKLRVDVLKEMSTFVKAINDAEANAICANIPALSVLLMKREGAKLDVLETAELIGTPEALYKIIDDADPSYIKSSEQFKAMKEAMEKLSKIDKEKDIAGYELWRDRAYEATKAYVEYKSFEFNNKEVKHSRSDVEIKRVKDARAVLTRLSIYKRNDFNPDLTNDNRFVANEDMDYKKGGKDFVFYQGVLCEALNELQKQLEDMKTLLTDFQEDRQANFGNDKREGSKEYQAMTDTLERCLDALDENRPLNEIGAKVRAFQKAAKYYHGKKGILFFEPQSDKGQRRYQVSGSVDDLTFPLEVCENAIRLFDKYRDKNGISYANKSYTDIDTIADALEKRYNKNEYLNDSKRAEYDSDEMYKYVKDKTVKQISVANRIFSSDKLMKENYLAGKGSDYYIALKPGRGIEELAKDYVAKKYLDIIYDPRVALKDITNVGKMCQDGSLKEEADQLAKDVVFKAIVRKYPKKAFSEWDKISKKADEIQNMFGDYYNTWHKGKYAHFNSEDEFINGSDMDKADAASFLMVTRMLATVGDPTGRLIAESLAVDPSVKPTDEVKRLISIGAEYIRELSVSRDIIEIKNDPKVIRDMDKKILESFRTSEVQRSEEVKLAEMNKNNNEVNMLHK